MKQLRSFILLCASVAVFIGFAQAEIQPEAQKVFDKYVEAVGGREKLEKLESVKMSMTMSMPAMGMSMSGTFVRKAPKLFSVEQEIPGMGSMRMAYNGEIGWTIVPMQGYRELSGKELAQQLEEQDIHAELKIAERYSTAEVSGTEMIGEEKHVVIKGVRSRTGTEDTLYFSEKTGLMRRMNTIADNGPAGQIPVEMDIVGYVEVEGYKMMSKVTMNNPAMNMNMEFSNIEINGEIDDSIFSPPSE